ncbi:kynurenine 3-monooxygenase-like protein [Aaosphaeria arxii CBS 175.79]|uniref:Kynurenine 3-monooxygenase n=1 Tax=Aaosphaeria arxii CBS 175.79 TaxID=1450172 RepID=A0A6A5YAJ5_9PLEO|nr:kynurenine 3-monooxygenase-like protein [Aaosphaeria arxii CBS 175.79]KAF2022256.1 kynurenine 3-monooxygenase-like protein [Aaosphaeria arxii CBS 175.79]
MPERFIVVGAGPVGSLAALYAAARGHIVEIYELRPDLRDPQTTPLNFAKSINLALSERGINSLRETALPEIVESVLSETFPMQGRMIHVQKNGKYIREAQLYDARGKKLLAMDRTGLNTALLDHLESMPNVTIHFSHKLTGIDFRSRTAWFERQTTNAARAIEIQVGFSFIIGADGAHSAVRYHMMKFVPMSYQQQYIDKLWCQFHIPPSETTGDFRIPPNYLHIWPQDESMFIALPNLDKSFTATLFSTRANFQALDTTTDILDFFTTKFPGVVPDLISPLELEDQYKSNPHLPLISIKCSPYHYSSTGVIVGDAAHAMVPFYGQGMNAGLEDVRVLFEILDRHPPNQRAKALDEYSRQRVSDAHTINDLALRNYAEMATDVKRPLYLVRKWIEETLDLWVPGFGWATQYSRVTFSNMRYSEVQDRAQRQARILNGVVGLALASAAVSGAFFVRAGGAERVKMGVLKSICWVARRGSELLQRVQG